MTLHRPKYFCKELQGLVLSGEEFGPISLAMPEERLRELVIAITTTEDIPRFIRQMMFLRDQARIGRITQKSTDPRVQEIIDATTAALEHHPHASLCTPFFAAMYAYENSLDHLLAMVDYFECCQETTN